MLGPGFDPGWLTKVSPSLTSSCSMLQTVKGVPSNAKVLSVYFPPHLPFTCPAPVLHISKTGPGWAVGILPCIRSSIARGLLGCCRVFTLSPVELSLCRHRALPAAPLLGCSEEITSCRMVSGLLCVIYGQPI